MASLAKSSSSNLFLGFALKPTNLMDLENFLRYANTYNPGTLFVIEGWKITSEDIVKYQIRPEVISLSGELTVETRFVKGSHELFLQLCKEGRNVHLFEFIKHFSRYNWLDASVAANVDVLREHAMHCHSRYILQDNQLNYGRPVTIIYGDNGMGKTTCLNHVRKELTIQNENQFILYLDDINLREFYRSFPSANIINFIEYFAVDLINPDVHIMYDNFERLKERDVIIDIMTDIHLKYRHVKQWITCSDAECRNKLESRLGTFACSLEPIPQESQIKYLTHVWRIEDDDEEHDLKGFIKSILDQCNKWNRKDIDYSVNTDCLHRFSTYPLHLRMIASAFSPRYELELSNVSILDVYEGFVNSIPSDEDIEVSAVLKLFEYMNDEFKFKTKVGLTPEALHSVNITNYLAAKWFSKNYHDHQEDLSLLMKSRGNWSFKYFFNSFLCRGKKLHTAALNRWNINDLCSAETVNERDAGGRTALHLVEEDYIMRSLLKAGASIDVRDDVLQWTPLQYCDYNGHLKCLNVLLERGADTRQLTWTLGLSEDKISKRFEIATSSPKLTFYVKFICQNVKKFQVTPRTINEVFLGLPNDVCMMVLSHAQKSTYHYVDSSGRTALFYAVEHNHFDAVKFLINNLGFGIHHRCGEGKTVFHVACEKGFTDIAKYLLDLGVDVNVSYGKTNSNAFTDCCIKGNVDVLKVLVENGAEVNVSLTTGQTPLEIACEYGNTAVVKYLYENAAKLKINYNISNDNLMDLLHGAVCSTSAELVEFLLNLSRNQIININKKFYGKSLLHMACVLNFQFKATMASLLVKAGADVNATDDNGCTPIFGMFDCYPYHVVRLLADSGCNLSHFNNDGETALHVFTRNCLNIFAGLADNFYDLTCLIYELITCGADVNARTPSGDTPLHFACRNSNIAVIRCLVSQGADIHAVNDNGETPLHLGCITECTQFPNTDFNTIKYLVSKGADVNARTNTDKTPIMYAVSVPSNVRELLNLGADVDCRDDDNKTLVHYFAEHNLLNELKVLARQGVKDAKSTDLAGQTALHIAAKKNHFECFKYLIKYFETDVNIVDNKGKTAVDLARNNSLSMKCSVES